MVVGTDVGRVFVGVYFPVGQDDRNAFRVCFFDDGGDGIRFVGRHHQQVHPFAYHHFDVAYLLCVVVFRRAEDHLCFGIEQGFAADFLVHLLAPFIIAALRHADDIPLLRCGASYEEEKGEQKVQEMDMDVFHRLGFLTEDEDKHFCPFVQKRVAVS